MVKNLPANVGDTGDTGSIPGWGRSPGGKMATHSSILDWKIHGQRGLVGYILQGHNELDMTVHNLKIFFYSMPQRGKCHITNNFLNIQLGMVYTPENKENTLSKKR